jgi:Lon protease-like protein
MEPIIPLFPLKLVVFPSSKYPLHIFETRYKAMLEYCIANEKGFGIVAKIGEDISSVGSFVQVSSILKKYDNGELDIIVEGINRFSITKIDVHPAGYFVADVNEYNDLNSEADPKIVEEIKDKFEEVLKKVNLHLEEAFWINFEKSSNKSFKIAEKSGLTIPEQQELLTIQDENSRLTYLKNHFEKLDEQISDNMTDNMIIINDGFIN